MEKEVAKIDSRIWNNMIWNKKCFADSPAGESFSVHQCAFSAHQRLIQTLPESLSMTLVVSFPAEAYTRSSFRWEGIATPVIDDTHNYNHIFFQTRKCICQTKKCICVEINFRWGSIATPLIDDRHNYNH